jgi:hypothetical protein
LWEARYLRMLRLELLDPDVRSTKRQQNKQNIHSAPGNELTITVRLRCPYKPAVLFLLTLFHNLVHARAGRTQPTCCRAPPARSCRASARCTRTSRLPHKQWTPARRHPPRTIPNHRHRARVRGEDIHRRRMRGPMARNAMSGATTSRPRRSAVAKR